MTIRVLQEYIRVLEDRLLHGDHSVHPEGLQALLGDKFREINPDGRVVSRDDVITWLLEKDPSYRWEFSDFEIQELGPGLVLASYRAKQVVPKKRGSKGARHCSLWHKQAGRETWQMAYHQSTRVK